MSDSEIAGTASNSQSTEGKANLFGFSRPQLEQLFLDRGLERFHGRQMFRWLYQRDETDFSAMTDLSLALREDLARDYSLLRSEPVDHQISSDGTEKLLFEMPGGARVETVRIPDERTTTACLSSQAGCALGCRFCATGTLKLQRDLTAGEIVLQAQALRKLHGSEAFSNIVFMGMGEPLLNYDELIKALEIITSPDGLDLAAKRITVSTAGITPKIRKLAQSGLRVNLALSLHAATQAKREGIMPVAKTFALDKLIAAVGDYAEVTKRRVTFEYVALAGYNDTAEDARALAKLIRGIDCKVNLLAYNPVPGLPYKRPEPDAIDRFAAQLAERRVVVTVRKSRGKDIDAACGQLAARSRSRAATPLTSDATGSERTQ